ncbi:DUF6065 family protein [Mesorhizobium sp. M1066]|uniref:DUF6065 family protein n=1 Tax=unclassified Mesorhizobium TaxID=325217 RepID=UPI0033366236
MVFTATLIPQPVEAQTVGPGTVNTTVSTGSGMTTVVGNTTISTTASTAATNVTGGTLIFDATKGPIAGRIIVQSVNGNAVQANGGAITVTNGINVRTQGGHAFLANGAASSIDISGAAISTSGVGAGLAAIGGTITALGVDINNTATSAPNVYLFRTNAGWALWVRGSPNSAKRNIVPLDGLVETEWLEFPFTMNWRFTRPGTVQFEKGEPFCFLTLVPHALLGQVQPEIRSLDEDQALKTRYEASKLAAHDGNAVPQGWQRHYVRGEDATGRSAGFHLSKRKLKPVKY